MNARLIELANKTSARTLTQPDDAWMIMFADLIIKDCIEQCQNVGAVIESMYDGEERRRFKAVADSCQRMIEQRLWVEE